MSKNINSDFLFPSCRPNTLHNYLIRQAILEALKSNQDNFHGTLLDVGCGEMPYKALLTSGFSKVKRYVGLDFENNAIHKNTPDIYWENGEIPLDDNSIDCVLCTEVLEHCPEPEDVLNEIYRVLKPNGIVFLTVPFLWPLHEVPYDNYRYTPFALERHLTHCHFSEIELKAMGGWDASLAQMLGLWVRRRPMGSYLRKFLSWGVFPIVWILGKVDKSIEPTFEEGTMLTGISGTARKSTE